MDGDPSNGQPFNKKIQDLQALTKGPLSSSISKLSGSSRALPTERDFHFYYNFDEFKKPVNEIADNSKSMLQTIGSSSHVWGKANTFPDDLDDAYDWLVDVNDDVFERFDASVDEFKNVRKVEEETGRRATGSVADMESGFQLVCGRKKKGMNFAANDLGKTEKVEGQNTSSIEVKVASRGNKAIGAKPRVPFHIPTIPRPQTRYSILVNNSNQPFEHVWLQKSVDGSRFIHPLENLSVLDFVDRNIEDLDPVKPLPVESSSFKFVEEVGDLKELAAKLRSANEFAVDLEHNQYRSFQGLTCLMQISTRTEDFIVDTLKLRMHVGPYLREVFKDPTKRKVMHGADRDIVWLQRDFGIYICNLFDTGQASRVLNLERNSLEHLLNHFCGVSANKEYQNADWRLRPLPDEMTKYACEDTHYLLHIYDLMRIRLLTVSKESESSDDHLIEVYKRSYDICMQLYEKELLTDISYLHIYGLQTSDFNAQQLAIVAGLCEWRDAVARAEDESTGYILPNKTLLEVAKQMPVTASKLRRILRSKHPYIEQHSGSAANVIKQAIQNAAAFESIAAQLKERRLEMASQAAIDAQGSEMLTSEHLAENGRVRSDGDHSTPEIPTETFSTSGQITDTNDTNVSHSEQVTAAPIQVLKKPSRAFGALFGNSASKRKFDTVKNSNDMMKIEQIKSSVNLPFHSFSGDEQQSKVDIHEQTEASTVFCPDDTPTVSPTVSTASSNVEEVIILEDDSDAEESKNVEPEPLTEQSEQRETNSDEVVLENDDEDDDEPMSLSELSSNFQKCFQTNNNNQTRKGKKAQNLQESAGFPQLKPFDYAAAIRFGEKTVNQSGTEGNEKQKSSGRKKSGQAIRKEESGDFQQGKRRQAFPSTGNRSATFRSG